MSRRSHKNVSQRTSSAQFDLFAFAAPSSKKSDTGDRHSTAEAKSADTPLSAAIRYVVGGDVQRGRPSKQPPPNTGSPEPRLLDVREAARRLGLSKSTLDKMRCAGTGPRFIRATARAVRYDPADLDAFANSRRRTSTMSDALCGMIGES